MALRGKSLWQLHAAKKKLITVSAPEFLQRPCKRVFVGVAMALTHDEIGPAVP